MYRWLVRVYPVLAVVQLTESGQIRIRQVCESAGPVMFLSGRVSPNFRDGLRQAEGRWKVVYE